MKIPMKWLREYVDIKLDPAAYAERMIRTGTAVEGWEETGAQFEGVVVGKIVACENHPDSDHLHICAVDVGRAEPLQIVCGAPNARAGIRVAVALEGARLPGGKIKKGKIRGVESFGMLCSGTELEVPAELYPHIGDEGIMELTGNLPLGADVKAEFGLGDVVMDYEILANRPDCLSVWGIARESAAALGEYCVMPEISVAEDGAGHFSDYATIEVHDTEACPRYCARVIEQVKIGPSPKWMREYLHAAGVRPINNIVDITNYVMLETGHPMHAFDLSKVRARTIIVRRAHPGEELTTLDLKEHVLDESMLVIADRVRATGLAGIMGGAESEIEEDTACVLFECAAFDRTNNRLTSRKLGIRTESSGRFEKGVCAATVMEALDRACMLVNMLECGRVVPGAYDSNPAPAHPAPVKASVRRINALTGVAISGEEMVDLLSTLNIEAALSGDMLTCTPPVWRRDVESEADIAEEALRLHGYEHIPSTLMHAVTMPGKRSAHQLFVDRVRHTAAAMGFYETLNYSFITPKWLECLGLPADDWRMGPIRLMNPLGEDTSAMRTTLVPTMLNVIAGNMHRGVAAGKFFEVSRVFRPTAEGQLPHEKLALCLGLYGEGCDFYAVKSPVEWLLGAFGAQARIEAAGDPYYHPGRKAVFTAGDVQVAQLGEMHPDVAARFEIEDRRVYVAEIDLEALMTLETPIYGIRELPKYPAVTRDLAVVVLETAGAGTVLETIRKAGGRILEDVSLFDVYRDPRLGDGKKSLAYAITFRASDRTLTEGEITSAMGKVLKALASAFGAEIRG